MESRDGLADFLVQVRDIVSTLDPVIVVAILVALSIVLITTIFWAVRRGSSTRRFILLVGLCDSGKTLIFSRLIYRKHLSTQTSIRDNAADFETGADKKKTLKLVDLPGHDRVRQQYFDKFKSSARGIILVVDGMTFHKDLKDVAELLYQLLTDRIISRNCPSLLVACNKSDQALAKGSRYVQSALEKELNNVRKTRSAALEATDGTTSTTAYLGRRDQNFTFADLRPMSVEFVECSAVGLNGDTGCQLDEVTQWLNKMA